VTSEQQLAEAIRNREPFIRLTGHIVLTGNYANGTNLLPELQVPTTITGGCTTLGGLCILDAKQLGRIFYGAGPWVKLSLINMRLVNGNSRDASGGAVLLEEGASLSVTNSAFERNWGHDGGAVDVKNGSDVDIVGSTFNNNKAGVTGGALRVEGNLLCTSCTFLENKAPVGGAVNLGPKTWAGFQQYTFQLNTGVRAGNDIAMDNSNTTVVSLDPFPPPPTLSIYPNATTKRANITLVQLGTVARPASKPLAAAPAAVASPPPAPPPSPPSPPAADPFQPSETPMHCSSWR
jgi:predicted outer membrane repeat protein